MHGPQLASHLSVFVNCHGEQNTDDVLQRAKELFAFLEDLTWNPWVRAHWKLVPLWGIWNLPVICIQSNMFCISGTSECYPLMLCLALRYGVAYSLAYLHGGLLDSCSCSTVEPLVRSSVKLLSNACLKLNYYHGLLWVTDWMADWLIGWLADWLEHRSCDKLAIPIFLISISNHSCTVVQCDNM